MVLLAIAFGAFSAQQFWPELRPAFGQGTRPTRRAEPARPSRHSPSSTGLGLRSVDPATARLGSDDFGSATPRTLVLVATSPGQNAADGTARLGTNPLNPQTYSAGAILLNGARLTQIYSDYVVLERGSESTRLYVQGKAPKARAAANPLLQVGGREATSNAPPAVAPASDDTRTAAITMYIRPNPVFEAEQLRGFSLLPGSQPAVFYKLGLRSGDMLTQINGAEVTDAEQVMDMLEQLTSGAAIAVTVERGGSAQRLTLDGSAIRPEQTEAPPSRAPPE